MVPFFFSVPSFLARSRQIQQPRFGLVTIVFNQLIEFFFSKGGKLGRFPIMDRRDQFKHKTDSLETIKSRRRQDDIGLYAI